MLFSADPLASVRTSLSLHAAAPLASVEHCALLGQVALPRTGIWCQGMRLISIQTHPRWLSGCEHCLLEGPRVLASKPTLHTLVAL